MFENSYFCVAIKNSEIVGSVKITYWNENLVLPIQKLFNINPNKLKSGENQRIWHIGRFAISKSEKDGAKLLRKLLAFAIYPICSDPNSIMLAECDSKFVRILSLIGIKTEILAPGIYYLGSETLPVYSTQEWLSIFLNKSPYFVEAKNFYLKNGLDRSSASYYSNGLSPISKNAVVPLINK